MSCKIYNILLYLIKLKFKSCNINLNKELLLQQFKYKNSAQLFNKALKHA